jgi:hypothetical protein
MPAYICSLVSSVRGDLAMRRAPTRSAAFEAARDLATEALAREVENRWLHNETVSIRVCCDPHAP